MLRFATPSRRIAVVAVLCSLVLSGQTAWADDRSSAAGLFQLREQLILDGEDGQLDDFTFVEGVLIASGVQQQTALTRYRAIYRQHADEALREAADLPAAGRAAGLFDYLHDRMLTGAYQADRTELDLTLADGSYNCVTATVLYCELCREAGVEAAAVAAPGHVFAQVTLDAQPAAVETTCSGWFSLLSDEQREEALAKRRGTQTGGERVLSDVELIAKVFYNRGVFQLERGNYADAIALIRLSLRLDPHDAAARANLLAAFNNWALVECEQKHWREALRLIEAGLRIDPDYEALRANQLHASHGLVSELCQTGLYAEAALLLEQGYQQRPDAHLFNDGRFTVYRSWVESLLRQGRSDEAQRVLARAYQVDPRRAEQIRLSLGA